MPMQRSSRCALVSPVRARSSNEKRARCIHCPLWSPLRQQKFVRTPALHMRTQDSFNSKDRNVFLLKP